MKLITIKGETTLFDGEKEITTMDRTLAWGYAFTMMHIRPIPCTTPSIYPVRSLTPHPKKRRLSNKMRRLVKEFKCENKNYTI